MLYMARMETEPRDRHVERRATTTLSRRYAHPHMTARPHTPSLPDISRARVAPREVKFYPVIAAPSVQRPKFYFRWSPSVLYMRLRKANGGRRTWFCEARC